MNHAHRAEAAEVCAGDAGIVGGLLWIGGEFEDSADHKSGRPTEGTRGHLPLRSRTCFRSSCLKTRRPSLTRSPRVALSRRPASGNGAERNCADSAAGTHRPQPGRIDPYG